MKFDNQIENIVALSIMLYLLLLITLIQSFTQDETLKIKQKQKSLGIITDIVDIGRYRHYRGYSHILYEGTLIVKYKVDKMEYYTKKRVKSHSPYISEYSIGDKISVVYNKKLPSDSAVDEIEIYEIAIYIIVLIEILIMIMLIYKRFAKKNQKIL